MDVIYAGIPQILTEQIYARYNGWSGSATSEQLQDAFTAGETDMQTYLGTYLVPTTLTGTFQFPYTDNRLLLPVSEVTWVGTPTVLLTNVFNGQLVSVTDQAAAFINADGSGVINMQILLQFLWTRCAFDGMPYQVQLPYTAGYPAGYLASQPAFLMGLVKAAELNLQQILDPGRAEGGLGNAGIIAWSSLKYSERRTDKSVRGSVFGNSVTANWIARKVEPFRKRRLRKL